MQWLKPAGGVRNVVSANWIIDPKDRGHVTSFCVCVGLRTVVAAATKPHKIRVITEPHGKKGDGNAFKLSNRKTPHDRSNSDELGKVKYQVLELGIGCKGPQAPSNAPVWTSARVVALGFLAAKM